MTRSDVEIWKEGHDHGWLACQAEWLTKLEQERRVNWIKLGVVVFVSCFLAVSAAFLALYVGINM